MTTINFYNYYGYDEVMRVIFSYKKETETFYSKQIEMTEIQYKKINSNFPETKYNLLNHYILSDQKFKYDVNIYFEIFDLPLYLKQLQFSKDAIEKGSYIMPCNALIDMCQKAIGEKGKIFICASDLNIQYPIR